MLSKIWKRIYTSVVYYFRLQGQNLGHNLHQFLIAIDQLLNALVGVIAGSKTWADETFSSRCWRWYRDGIRKWPANIVDTIFFFDRTDDKKHCELSYISEQKGSQLPPEMRP